MTPKLLLLLPAAMKIEPDDIYSPPKAVVNTPKAKMGINDTTGKVVRVTLAAALLQIGLMDLSLSIDNVIAAIGLAPKDPVTRAPVMWPIYTGVFIAILALQAIAPHAMKLLKKYPILEPTAFILIGFVGMILIFEESWHAITGEVLHIPPYFKFIGILAIVWVALLYSADGAVRRLLHPFIRAALPLMRTFARLIGLIFLPIALLVSAVTPKRRSKAAD